MIDSSIALGIKPMQIEDSSNALAKVLQLQGAQQANALNSMRMGEMQRGVAEQNAIAKLMSDPANYKDGALDYTGLTPKLYAAAPTKAGALVKSFTDQRTAEANLQKTGGEVLKQRVGLYRDNVGNVNDPQTAAQFIQTMYADPALKGTPLTAEPLDHALSSIPTDPAALDGWKKQFALGATKFTELNKPSTQIRNTGATTDVLSIPGLGGAPTVVSSLKNTASPDAIMQASTSTANNKRTIEAENLRAGVGAGGGLDANAELTAKAIASGQLPAPTGMALLNPKNQRILGRVMELNPQYDSTTVTAKKKAASDFTTGALGNSMRSFAVAGQHLDQLGTLVDAMNNGNMQLVNKIGNMYSQQTGSPAVTNFDAAKDVVSKEVVKAIVAGGGGVAEREELSKLMQNANSPAQLKGVISQYRSLMAAQHDALLQQRRAAGLPDSTLPSYTEANGSAPAAAPAGVPSDIAAILAKHGGK